MEEIRGFDSGNKFGMTSFYLLNHKQGILGTDFSSSRIVSC